MPPAARPCSRPWAAAAATSWTARPSATNYFPLINRLHGPNLVNTGSKVSRGWVYAWLKNPKQYYPDTNMPNLRLTDEEAADLTAYLTDTPNHNPQYENVQLPAVDGKVRDELALSYLQDLYTIDRSRAKLAAMPERGAQRLSSARRRSPSTAATAATTSRGSRT